MHALRSVAAPDYTSRISAVNESARDVSSVFFHFWSSFSGSKMVSTLSGVTVPNGFDPAFEYEFSDGEDSKNVYQEQESDEDTEDASETDAAKLEEEFTEMKEQMYKEKLASLKKQLQSLKDGSHPELNRKLKKLEQVNKERLRMAEAARSCEIEAVEREYIREKKSAVADMEQKKIDLKENLLIELEDKRRMIEGDRLTMELTSLVDPLEVKPASTRKLRRRQNEPVPLPEKRRKPSPAQFCFLLSDEEIASDMKALNKQIKAASNKKSSVAPNNKPHAPTNNNNSNIPSGSTASTSSAPTQPKYVVRIADSKLFYEKRWFHRGQNIYVDSKDTGKVSAVISSIGTNEIWVRKTADNQKMRIYVSQMQKGKYKIRKRST
ncbi:sin3 histone deacetylase corepressor complex component SDS3-like isoform X2 [Acanthaster planci]|uniref:Sin3 histone deacetylase corepressor complex component SDS3-like isoform X2 n=1 Tax=Acanthaster planci TaxID=133434 RepID=A0A8B7Y0K4_ACAPL|nr:sin3 histone deacetylase corepressor complex component SDS3-like isoform X2 [Acanthaster planci]